MGIRPLPRPAIAINTRCLMGGLCCKFEETRHQRAADDGELELSTRSRSGTRSPGSTRSPVPEAVQNLELVQSRKGEPSANLKWELPANLVRSQDVSHYIVRVSSGVSNKVLWEMEVDGGKTQVDFPEDKYLEPLCPYIFGVQAKNSNYVTGDWSMLDGCIDWQCRFPGCEKNRLKLEDGVYDFCSRDHKIEFDEGYCLYCDCTQQAVYEDSAQTTSASTSANASTAQPKLIREENHFCSYDHYFRILTTEPGKSPGFFIEVRSGSPEYKAVEEHFQKTWSSKERKTPPSLTLVLAIFNPSLDQSFKEYKQLYLDNEKKEGKMLKKLFYGTALGCDLHTYQVPCDITHSTECSTCNVALHGFGRLCTSGVTLDKNPARSHNKAEVHMDSLTYGLLLCDVACTNSKKVARSMSDSKMILPEKFDAVKVNLKSGPLKTSTDEVIVYKANAICPRYILLYV